MPTLSVCHSARQAWLRGAPRILYLTLVAWCPTHSVFDTFYSERILYNDVLDTMHDRGLFSEVNDLNNPVEEARRPTHSVENTFYRERIL